MLDENNPYSWQQTSRREQTAAPLSSLAITTCLFADVTNMASFLTLTGLADSCDANNSIDRILFRSSVDLEFTVTSRRSNRVLRWER